MSLTAKLDKANPRGVHIGDYSHLTFQTAILAHDFSRQINVDTYIGAYCFIGCGAIIMPGVRIGDHCIIGSGSVVTKDIPANSIAVGNPARILRQGIMTDKLGVLIEPPRETPDTLISLMLPSGGELP